AHMESYNDKLKGQMLHDIVSTKERIHRLYYDKTYYLSIFDQFAEKVDKARAGDAVRAARAFLTEDNPKGPYEGATIKNVFSKMSKAISFATATEDSGYKDADWQGYVFDATNKLLFQKLTRI